MVTGTGSSSIEFRVLGSVFLTGPEGNQLHSILARPKLVALLSRLAIEPGAFVRRDTLIGLLWPSLDLDRARSALRQSLYHLRRSLGEDVVVSRGDDEVGLDAARIWCDAAAISDALAGGDRETGIELYRGDFLEGFFLPGAPEFERWVEGRRETLRELAASAAADLARTRAAGGDAEAAHWARLGIRLTPLDERRVRACLKVFVALDDRASAVREYDAFAARLSEDLGLEPTRETRDVVDGLRTGDSDTAQVERSELEPASQPPQQSPFDREPMAEDGSRPAPVVRTRAFRLGVTAGAVVVLALLAMWAFGPDPAPLERGRVLVTSFVNDTGDPDLEPLGRMTEDWVVRGLEETGLIDVVVLTGQANADGYDSVSQALGTRQDRAIALATTAGAGVAVTGAIYAVGDSVQFEVQVLDVARRRHLASVEPARAPRDQPLEALEEVRQRIAGALAMALDGRIDDFTDSSKQPPTYEAYLAFVQGEDSYNRAFDRSRNSDFGEAQQLFLRAFELDSTLTVALMRAGEAAWLNMDGLAADSLAQAAAMHRENFNAFSRARLDLLQARLIGDRDAALRAARRLTSTPLDRAIAAFQANRPAETVATLEGASEYARAVGDFGYYGIEVSYWLFLANAHHLLGAHHEEIEVVRKGRDRYPDEVLLAALEMRALAALGRADELQRVIDSSLRLPRVRYPWLGGGIWRAAGELRAHGSLEASRAVANRAVDWYLALPPDEAARWGARNGHAKSYYVAERWEESEAAFLAMDEERPDIRDVVGFLGVLAARRGDREEALRRAEQVAELGSPYEHGRGIYWQACIATQLGDPERGISLLLEAYSQGRVMDVGLHSDMDLEPLHDDPRYQELVRPKG